jgi:hypothetical protein
MRNVIFSIFVIVCLHAGPSVAQECPPDHKTGDITGPYSLNFHAWAWENEFRSFYRHCVSNVGSNTTWVNWEKASITSYIPPNKYISRSSETISGVKPEMATLWYGAKPESISVKTMVQSGDKAIAHKNPYSPLGTQAVFFMPFFPSSDNSDLSRSTLTREKIATLIEKSPSILSEVGMNYESIPQFDDDGKLVGINHKCSYEIIGSTWTPKFLKMQIADARINDILFRNGPVISSVPGAVRMVFEGTVGVNSQLVKNFRKENVELRVMLPGTDLVVARLDVAIYNSSNQEIATIAP